MGDLRKKEGLVKDSLIFVENNDENFPVYIDPQSVRRVDDTLLAVSIIVVPDKRNLTFLRKERGLDVTGYAVLEYIEYHYVFQTEKRYYILNKTVYRTEEDSIISKFYNQALDSRWRNIESGTIEERILSITIATLEEQEVAREEQEKKSREEWKALKNKVLTEQVLQTQLQPEQTSQPKNKAPTEQVLQDKSQSVQTATPETTEEHSIIKNIISIIVLCTSLVLYGSIRGLVRSGSPIIGDIMNICLTGGAWCRGWKWRALIPTSINYFLSIFFLSLGIEELGMYVVLQLANWVVLLLLIIFRRQESTADFLKKTLLKKDKVQGVKSQSVEKKDVKQQDAVTPDTSVDPTNQTKTCPECAETIKLAAKVCRYCHYRFSEEEITNAFKEKGINR